MKSLLYFLSECNSSLCDVLFENRIINFGRANANYNQCVILAGGAASGKGTIQHKIDLVGKVFDVDELKKMYQKMQSKGKIDDDKEYDMANPEDTAELHQKVKDKKWKSKQRKQWFNHHSDKSAHKSDNYPNIIFDMVSDDIKDIEEVAVMAKQIGYTVTVVWVVTNMETAKFNNMVRGINDKKRRRSVPDSIIEKGHKGAYKTMNDLFSNKYPELNELIDFAWVGFGTGFGRSLKPEFEKSPVRKIKKDKEDKWIFDKGMIDSYLAEQQPINYDNGNGSILDRYENASEANDAQSKYELERLKKFVEANKDDKEFIKWAKRKCPKLFE